MGEYEDILERLRTGEIDSEEAANQLDRFKGSSLREKAEKLPAVERERDEWKSKAERLEMAPKRDKAFRDYGVDYDRLTKAEQREIGRYEGELDAEKIGAFVEDLELPMTDGPAAPPAQVEPNGAAVTRAARNAPVSQRMGQAGQMTPDEAAQRAQTDPGWWDDWSTQHPFEAEQLEKGITVRV